MPIVGEVISAGKGIARIFGGGGGKPLTGRGKTLSGIYQRHGMGKDQADSSARHWEKSYDCSVPTANAGAVDSIASTLTAGEFEELKTAMQGGGCYLPAGWRPSSGGAAPTVQQRLQEANPSVNYGGAPALVPVQSLGALGVPLAPYVPIALIGVGLVALVLLARRK
jgi:hypothetical protein